MWWIIGIWLLVGVVTSIFYIIDAIKSKLSLNLKDLGLIIAWILIGPILWSSFGIISLTDFIQNHLDDDIIKFK